MTRFHLFFHLPSFIRHKNLSNLRLHVVTSALGWLGLVTALSRVPLPLHVPLLGSNLGAVFVVGAVVDWLFVDALVALAVGAITVLWALAAAPLWGSGHGIVGMVVPLSVAVAAVTMAHYAHIYWHEHASFLRGDPPLRAAVARAHRLVFAPLHHGLDALLHRWVPARSEARPRRDRQLSAALRTRLSVPWSNWAGLASCRPRYVSTPSTVEELVEAVRAARERGDHIRVVASGFSWSSVVLSEETLIFCERLDRVEVDVTDPSAPCAWVEAGVTNRKLNRVLADHGLSMPWNVVLENVRIAGIASTGTHGTGRATSTIGDLVDVFEVVDANGCLRVLSEATVGADTMSAARLGLGLFGVIARMKIRVVPLHRVRQTDARVPVASVLGELPALVRAHDSVELYWFPFQRDMWVKTIDRTDEPRTFHGHGIWFKTQNFLENVWMMASSKVVARFAPWATPALLSFGMRMLPFRSRVLDLPESHHYHHWIELMPAGCMEVGFKADPECENVRAAFEATVRIVDAYAARGLYPLNLTLNVRFIGPSGALLTPAYGPGLTAYIEIMWMGRPNGWREFSSELCQEWLKVPGALPHWSKEFEHVDDVVSTIRTQLGKRRWRFLALLARTGIDPDRVFMNPLLRRVLVDEQEEG